MQKIYKVFAGVFSAAILSLLALIVYAQLSLPDSLTVREGEALYINPRLSLVAVGKTDLRVSMMPVVSDSDGNSYRLDLKLFESVPIKQVQIRVVERDTVVPGGMPFGIKMHTDGVIVVGLSDVQCGSETINPAKNAGLKVGDVLHSIDGIELKRNSDVAKIISACDGQEVKVTFSRDGQEMDAYVQPVMSDYDEAYRAGIWVRDSSAGIGTMTYYHPDTLAFAGLGHAVCDVDTGDVMPLSSGTIVDVNISGANAGYSGKPGELKGSFVGANPIGQLYENGDTGIYGVLSEGLSLSDPVEIALKQEIEPGPASILCTVSGNKPQQFDIRIEKINYSDHNTTKSMVIKVTDPHLLSITGGIVQGMSGSPIMQNDKIVGAVTHVFVNDPTRGYGIFVENMEKTLNYVESEYCSA